MECSIHGDDFGLTRGITDDILDCYDHGSLNSTSIVPNGHAFSYAIEEYRKRPGLRLAVHLNIAEGVPVSRGDVMAPLIDDAGNFHLSFMALWLRYLASRRTDRLALREAVQHEIAEQVAKVREETGHDVPIRIDSHQHYHMIPFVLDSIIELRDQCNIAYVRLPREPFFWCGRTVRQWANYVSANLVKHLLLNALARNLGSCLAERGIEHCDRLIGVLFTGKMSEAVVRAAVARLPSGADGRLVEVLFHPGQARPGEEVVWAKCPKLGRYYLSPWRNAERETLKSPGFGRLIEAVRNDPQ